jgi:hypothetical protein
MAQRPPPIDRFSNNLRVFIKDLYNLGIRLNQEKKINISTIKLNVFHNYFADPNKALEFISEFIKNSYPHWDNIAKKEESFINEGLIKTMFPNSESSDVSSVLPLLSSPDMVEEKDNAWVKITSLVKISIFYVYLQRSPIVLGQQNYRNPSFMPHVDVVKYAKSFGLNLAEAF